MQKDIDKVIEAIIAGMLHSSMKDKMDELEAKKTAIMIRLEEAKYQTKVNTPTKEMITMYLQNNADLKSKNPDDQRKVIQAYVKDVVVFENEVEINTIVTFDGGGDGSRTRV